MLEIKEQKMKFMLKEQIHTFVIYIQTEKNVYVLDKFSKYIYIKLTNMHSSKGLCGFYRKHNLESYRLKMMIFA